LIDPAGALFALHHMLIFFRRSKTCLLNATRIENGVREMRRLFAVVIAFLATTFSPSTMAQDPLRIGFFDLPPHVTGIEDGQPRGAAISYFENYIAPHFDVTFEWAVEVTAPTRLMSQLGDGEIDAMIFLGKTAERTKVFHYPDPYLIIPETIALKSKHQIEQIKSVEDLHGLRLGFLAGGRIPEPLQIDEITYDLIAGKRLMERNVEKLMLGRIDGIYAPLSTALLNIIEEMELRDEVKLVPIEFLDPVEIFTVFSQESVDPDIVSRYNSALSAARAEMAYEDFLPKFLEGSP
jgi:polar amino acid transport system substrate-binding protein